MIDLPLVQQLAMLLYHCAIESELPLFCLLEFLYLARQPTTQIRMASPKNAASPIMGSFFA
jgi:hypothetical protein